MPIVKKLPHDIDYFVFSKTKEANIFLKSILWQMKREPINTWWSLTFNTKIINFISLGFYTKTIKICEQSSSK